MSFIRRATVFLLLGVMFALGAGRVTMGRTVGRMGGGDVSSLAKGFDEDRILLAGGCCLGVVTPVVEVETAQHCAHCEHRDHSSDRVKVAVSGLTGAGLTGAGRGGCDQCPSHGCGGCCGNDCPSLFLSESACWITGPVRPHQCPPEDWAAAQRTHRPLLQPPRCA